MKKCLGIIGGDLRIVNLEYLLTKDNYEVYTYGLEKKIYNNTNLEEMANKVDIVITSIPISKDGVAINTPFSDNKLFITDIFAILKNKKIISGAVNENINKIANENNIEIVDILKDEELACLNAIPTAEGAIQIAMQESNITLHNSNSLVLGFGRIGKILSKMLYGIGANVFCEARKEKDIEKIKTYGYNEIALEDLDNNLERYDFIFNTIPYLILDKNRISKLKKDCIIIDLASSPGGVDFESAKKLNIKAFLELGLPGRVAPMTSAQYIKNIIEKNINN